MSAHKMNFLHFTLTLQNFRDMLTHYQNSLAWGPIHWSRHSVVVIQAQNASIKVCKPSSLGTSHPWGHYIVGTTSPMYIKCTAFSFLHQVESSCPHQYTSLSQCPFHTFSQHDQLIIRYHYQNSHKRTGLKGFLHLANIPQKTVKRARATTAVPVEHCTTFPGVSALKKAHSSVANYILAALGCLNLMPCLTRLLLSWNLYGTNSTHYTTRSKFSLKKA